MLARNATPSRRARVNATATRALRSVRLLIPLAGATLIACSSSDRPAVLDPSDERRINLRVASVELTQATQDEAGALPMIAGRAAAVNVAVVRSVATVAEVKVVLRLSRGGRVVFSDTARTGGVLGPDIPASRTSAQFLIPDTLLADGISWQVEVDPQRQTPDSTRTDNTWPLGGPEAIRTVTVRPIRIRLIPIILSRHGGIRGDVSPSNADQYVMLARQIYPLASVTVSVGAAVTSDANFGQPAAPAADANFWQTVLAVLDGARNAAGATDEYWYGVVPYPDEYSGLVYAGYGYIPRSPNDAGMFARVSAGLSVSSRFSVPSAQQTFAHELGHNLGRNHAPGCGAVAPIDSAFPGVAGRITISGNDVWSWSTGLARSAQSVSRETGDVMSYCSPVWISPYTYRSVLTWRQAPPALGRVISTRLAVAMP